MGFTSIYTHQFRNLVSTKVDTNARIIYLIGKNGQGKTNFLESIYCICFGSSFRTNNTKQLLCHGKEEMSVYGEFENAVEGDDITIGFAVQGKKKKIMVDGKNITDRKELVQNVPCIIFSHEDIEFVKGSPDRKRFFFNQVMSLYKPAFIDTLRNYTKVLKMRNVELKEGHYEHLDVFDYQLAEYGSLIQMERQKTIEEFNKTFSEGYRNIYQIIGEENDIPIQILYKPSWKNWTIRDEILEILLENRQRDQMYQVTTTGPHRDHFQFRKSGKNFASSASTGQFRLAALTLRVAQAVFFSQKTRRNPVLLVDDVLLELDGKKKEAFLQALPDFEQAFFTFLPEEKYERFYYGSEVLEYMVEQGALRHEKSG